MKFGVVLLALLLAAVVLAGSVGASDVNITREGTFVNASFYPNGTVFSYATAGTDDSGVIQAGLSNLTSGDTLYFGAGTYTVGLPHAAVYTNWKSAFVINSDGVNVTGSPSAIVKLNSELDTIDGEQQSSMSTNPA